MKKQKLISNEQGMVAIITTMILMIVISLIVLGFSQSVRRNQRQVLDAQLSSQAFYAAESGLNLARKQLELKADYTKNGCDEDTAPGSVLNNYTVSGDSEITCLLVQPVDDLKYDSVGGKASVGLINPVTDSIDNIIINWESSTSTSSVLNCGGGTTMPVTWNCNQPLLRVDLLPLADDGSIAIANLGAEQITAFLYPNGSGGGVSAWDAVAATNKKGDIVQVNCDTTTSSDKTSKCMVNITVPTSDRYAVRMMGIYGVANTRLHLPGKPILTEGQMLVDSTARSVDVLRRVQARVPVGSKITDGNFVIDSRTALCKAYTVTANSTAAIDPGAAGCNL